MPEKEFQESIVLNKEIKIEPWDKKNAILTALVGGLMQESGELLKVVHEASLYGKPLSRANFVDELGDVQFYNNAIARIAGVNLDDVRLRNKLKTTLRVANGKNKDEEAFIFKDLENKEP